MEIMLLQMINLEPRIYICELFENGHSLVQLVIILVYTVKKLCLISDLYSVNFLNYVFFYTSNIEKPVENL